MANKIYVHIESRVPGLNKDAKAALGAEVKRKLVTASNQAAAKGLPRDFSNKHGDKPKKNDRLYDAIKVMPKVKLSVEKKGSNLKVSANVSFEIGLLKMPKTKKAFMIPTNITSNAATEGRASFEVLAKDLITPTVTPVTRKTLSHPSMKAKLQDKGFDV